MYLGDGEFIQERFDKALEYYLTAFEYCDETRDFAATALILSKLGITQYYQHDLKHWLNLHFGKIVLKCKSSAVYVL